MVNHSKILVPPLLFSSLSQSALRFRFRSLLDDNIGRLQGHGYYLLKKNLDMQHFADIRRPRRTVGVGVCELLTAYVSKSKIKN